MHNAADLHARLARAIEDLRALVGRVDSNGSDLVLDQLTSSGDLTDAVACLRHAHELLINIAETLTSVVGAHHTHGNCHDRFSRQHHATVPALTPQDFTTIDAAEAWRRAHLHLPDHRDDPILIHIQEFEDGYQAIPILATIPEPPPVPTVETPTTLVIDKTTAIVTRWPLLPVDVLANQYRRYQHQEPMNLDDSR